MEPLLSRTKLGNSFNGSPQPEILQDFHKTKPTTSEMGRKTEPIWIHDQTSSRNKIRKTQRSKPTSGVREGEEGAETIPDPILKPKLFISAVTAIHPFLIKRLNPNAKLPIRGTNLSAGVDIMANKELIIPPKQRRPVQTGIAISIPGNTYARIAPRSSLPAKYEIDIGAGVIDQDYRGEIKVLMINNPNSHFQVRPGDRIAQLILERVVLVTPQEVEILDKTTRGNKGFRSTGYGETLAKTISSIKATPFKGTFLARVELATKQDKDYLRIKAKTSRDEIRDNLVYVKGRLYIPDNEAIKIEILESEHDSQIAGHFDQRKTYEIITRNFYWPKMEEWINQYIQTCDTCQRSKSKRHAKYGLLQPLEVPYAPWKSISVDFIVALPESEGFHQIMVVVDRSTKMAHFIPLNENATTSDVTRSFHKA